MTSRPYIKIWSTDPSCEYPIVKPASLKREFLDNTLEGHGYRCQPMSMANRHGWEFLLPQDVEVIWDGISDTSSTHVKILKGEYLPNGLRLVDPKTANGTITFFLNSYIETDPGHYLIMNGPSNHFVLGAVPMNALIRSDLTHKNDLQYCWQLTLANTPILFKKGTPFLTIYNYPVSLLESTNVEIAPVTKEIIEAASKYNQDRSELRGDKFSDFPSLYKKMLGSVSAPKPTNPEIKYFNE